MPKPKPLSKQSGDKSKKCEYHRTYGHTTDECHNLRDEIEDRIRRGRLEQYVDRTSTLDHISYKKGERNIGQGSALQRLGKRPQEDNEDNDDQQHPPH